MGHRGHDGVLPPVGTHRDRGDQPIAADVTQISYTVEVDQVAGYLGLGQRAPPTAWRPRDLLTLAVLLPKHGWHKRRPGRAGRRSQSSHGRSSSASASDACGGASSASKAVRWMSAIKGSCTSKTRTPISESRTPISELLTTNYRATFRQILRNAVEGRTEILRRIYVGNIHGLRRKLL